MDRALDYGHVGLPTKFARRSRRRGRPGGRGASASGRDVSFDLHQAWAHQKGRRPRWHCRVWRGMPRWRTQCPLHPIPDKIICCPRCRKPTGIAGCRSSNRSIYRWETVLYESGGTQSHVYFPTTAIVSLLYVMENGASARARKIPMPPHPMPTIDARRIPTARTMTPPARRRFAVRGAAAMASE